MPLPHSRRAISMFLCAIAVAAMLAPAEPVQPQHEAALRADFVAGANPSSIYGREPDQVYVRDSAIAIEKFALAERMERLHEWSKAADIYQEVLANYADRVVPSQVDNDKRIIQYTSVVPAVQERLARWPAEGLTAYRARYEIEAQSLLDAAKPGDVAALHKVYSSFFITEAGKSAGLRIIDSSLESGDFASAAWTADRLLAIHPGLGADRPRLIYRAAVAHHLSGNSAAAMAKLAELKKDSPDALGRVRGEDVRLVDSLASELATSRPIVAVSGGESWPMPFGSPDRARVSPSVGSVGANIATINLVRPDYRAVPGMQAQVDARTEIDRKAGLMTGVYPVVDRGELFFQDNARVYAVGLETGLPLPGWAQTYDGDRAGQYVAAGCMSSPRSQHYAVALTDDSVFAIVGQTDVIAVMGGMYTTYSPHDTRLVCLDRKTGRERWTIRPRQLSLDPATAALKDMDFSGSPLIVNDSLYLIARGGKGLQFEDCYVVCLDLSTGKSKWITYVASANVGGQFFDIEPGGSTGQNLSHLAYSSGRIFCQTNLGAVAALSAFDGTIAWLNIYPREVVDAGMWPRRFKKHVSEDQPWTFNPVIVSEGRVFVLPSDGLNLQIYDAGDGSSVKQIPLRSVDNAKTLLGVVGDRLVLAATDKVLCVNWPQYDAKQPLTQNLFWRTNPLRRGSAEGGEPIKGRGFVSSDSVFIPLDWRLIRLSLSRGIIADYYPADSWGENEGPGNVLATPEHLIIAGATRVSVYTDLAMAIRKLDAAVAETPTDPKPRLSYAELMFVGGKTDAAVTRLDEAIELLGGRKTMAPGAARDRVFADSLTFAQNLTRDARGVSSEIINGLFDRATDAALSPQQHVNLRFSRAEFARSSKDSVTELRLRQEILVDPQWRLVPVTRGDRSGSRQAGTIAAAAIDEILRRPDGRGLYAPYEQKAAQAVDAARPAANPTALIEISQAYPNSNAARDALRLAADAYESASNPRQAVQALRQLYFRNPDAPDRAKLLEGMARNYLAMPNHVDAAAARLAQAARSFGANRLSRPMQLSDGQLLHNVTFAEALAAVRRIQSNQTDRRLPDLRMPTGGPPTPSPFKPEPDTSIIDGVAMLCVPDSSFTRLDRIVTFTPGAGLSCYAVGSVQPLFTSNAIDQAPRDVAWTGGNLLVWTNTHLVMLDGESGRAVWDIAPTSLPEVEVVTSTDPDAVSASGGDEDGDVANGTVQVQQLGGDNAIIINNANGGQRLVIRAGQVVAAGGVVRVRGGVVRFGQAPVAQPVDPNAPRSEMIVAVRPLSDRAVLATSTGRIVAVDLSEGKVQWQARPSQASVTKLAANDDFVAARISDVNGSLLIALDAFDGNTVFRRSFARDPSGLALPINLALANDGTLVWLTTDRVMGKDLFESGDSLRFGGGALRPEEGENIYAMSSGDEQLLIAGERILAVSDNGAYVRVLSLETGLMLNGSGTVMNMATGVPSNGVAAPRLRVVGSMLYVLGPASVIAYDLDHPGASWRTPDAEFMGSGKGPRNAQVSFVLNDAIVGRTHLAIIGQTRAPAPGLLAAPPPGMIRFAAHSRDRLPGGGESGSLLHILDIKTNGLVACQGVDGGLYYLAGDQKLHFLAGAGK